MKVRKQLARGLAVALCAVMAAGAAPTVVSAAPTDKGAVLYTDITAYVGGQQIPYYLMDTSVAAVAVTDLTNYGFDVATNAAAKTATLTYNPNKTVATLPATESVGKVGATAYRFWTTDWKVSVNGKAVDSYNIAGRLSIPFKELDVFGTRVYDAKNKTTKLTLKSMAAVTTPPPAVTTPKPTATPAGVKYIVSGLVTTVGGTPVVGASVKVIDANSGTAYTGKTTASGTYMIGGVPSGATVYVEATAAGSGTGKTDTFGVSANASAKDVVLGNPGTVTGRVRTSLGSVLPGATVKLTPASGTTLTQTTDSAGQYTFPNAAPGQYTLSVSASGYNTTNVSAFTVSGATVTKDVTMGVNGPSVIGAVYVPAGMYVDPASVTVQLFDSGNVAYSNAEPVTFSNNYNTAMTSERFNISLTRTATVSVTLYAVVSYRYKSNANASSYGNTGTMYSKSVSVNTTAVQTDLGTIQLSFNGVGYNVSGTFSTYNLATNKQVLVYITGTPDAGASWPGNNQSVYAEYYSRGGYWSYTIPNVPAGRYTVWAVADGAEVTERKSVTVTNGDVANVTLPELSSAQVTLTLMVREYGNLYRHTTFQIDLVDIYRHNIGTATFRFGDQYKNQTQTMTFPNVPIGSYTLRFYDLDTRDYVGEAIGERYGYSITGGSFPISATIDLSEYVVNK